MKRLVIEAVQTQKPRNVAVELIRSDHVPNPSQFAEALRNWIMLHVDIIDEFEELVISPNRMIDEIQLMGRTAGDCDDVAMLAAAVLASVGAMTQLTACFPQDDGSYAHVFTRYKFPRQAEWIDFDPTIGYHNPKYPADVLTVDIVS